MISLGLNAHVEKMLQNRAFAEEQMAKSFCAFYRIEPERCSLQMREMPDGSTEYWFAFESGEPQFMGRALPLETTSEGDTIEIRQRFELVQLPIMMKTTL